MTVKTDTQAEEESCHSGLLSAAISKRSLYFHITYIFFFFLHFGENLLI